MSSEVLGCRLIYVPTKNLEEAKVILRNLLEERLVACGNIIEKLYSSFWWEGKIEEAEESLLLVKTSAKLEEQVIQRIRELHSYQCPCILSFDLATGYLPFLEWIHQETQKTDHST